MGLPVTLPVLHHPCGMREVIGSPWLPKHPHDCPTCRRIADTIATVVRTAP